MQNPEGFSVFIYGGVVTAEEMLASFQGPSIYKSTESSLHKEKPTLRDPLRIPAQRKGRGEEMTQANAYNTSDYEPVTLTSSSSTTSLNSRQLR